MLKTGRALSEYRVCAVCACALEEEEEGNTFSGLVFCF